MDAFIRPFAQSYQLVSKGKIDNKAFQDLSNAMQSAYDEYAANLDPKPTETEKAFYLRAALCMLFEQPEVRDFFKLMSHDQIAAMKTDGLDALQRELLDIAQNFSRVRLYDKKSIGEGVVDEVDGQLHTKLSEFEKEALHLRDLERGCEEIIEDVNKGNISADQQAVLQSKLREDFIKNMVAVLNYIDGLAYSAEAKDLIRKEVIIKHSITSIDELKGLLEIESKIDFDEVFKSIKKKKATDKICSYFSYATEDIMKEIGQLVNNLGLSQDWESINLDMLFSKFLVVMQGVEHQHPEIKAFAEGFKNSSEKLDEFISTNNQLYESVKNDSNMNQEEANSLNQAINLFTDYLRAATNYKKHCYEYSGVDPTKVPYL